MPDRAGDARVIHKRPVFDEGTTLTTRRPWRRTVLATLATTAALLPPAALPVANAAAAAVQNPDRTSPVEARRVDRIPTPRIDWQPCYEIAECALVPLPLDYDDPTGPQIDIAVARVRARDQAHRIGSLFLNPGGPGGSGVEIALAAPQFVGNEIRDRFDIVGIDPRGTNASTQVRCFASAEQQQAALAGLTDVSFPFTKPQERAAVVSSRAAGRACSSAGRPLSASMSTAEVARDFDVMRRAVGDRQLTYLGFSYGSYLGQVYANLFPDRIRALVIDGVVDPVAWAGTPRTADQPFVDRLRSADGTFKAFTEILHRCDVAGEQACAFAAGNPQARFGALSQRIKAHPLVLEDPEHGTVSVTYDVLISGIVDFLYSPDGYRPITDMLADLWLLTAPATTPEATTAARREVARLLSTGGAIGTAPKPSAPEATDEYDHWFEASSAVACTDTLNPGDAATWPAAAAAADRRAPYFGRPWAWWGSACAHRTWTAQDEDAYRGPFTRRTSAPILVVGNLWDPATNYDGAVTAARLLPNSRLISSDSWGHAAYLTSACVTGAVDHYLLTGQAPGATLHCRGDVQPFEPIPASAQVRPRDLVRDLVRDRAHLPIVPLLPTRPGNAVPGS